MYFPVAQRLLSAGGMRYIARLGWLLVVSCAVAPAELSAQSTGRVAVGVSVSSKLASDPDAHGSPGIGVLYRLGHGRQGWGWKYGLNWYSAELDQSLGGESQEFGKIRIRPLMGGYGYTHLFGRTKVSASLMGGYAFTSFVVHDTFDQAYRVTRGVESIDTSSSNAFVLKPQISGWYDINEKMGFNVSAGYMIARPSVTVITPLGRDRQSIRADMFTIKAGLVYSVF